MINPSPTAISSSGAAWLIYILSIYIQMKMACLVMEIGMQTHIMPPQHFVETYNSVLSGFCLVQCFGSHFAEYQIHQIRLSCPDRDKHVLQKIIQDFGIVRVYVELILPNTEPVRQLTKAAVSVVQRSYPTVAMSAQVIRDGPQIFISV